MVYLTILRSYWFRPRKFLYLRKWPVFKIAKLGWAIYSVEYLNSNLPVTSLSFFLFSQILGKGINRIGNLLVPNDNYVKFEDWMLPILDAMLLEQKESGVVWTPSKVIARLGTIHILRKHLWSKKLSLIA